MKNVFELIISAVAVFLSYGGWKLGAQVSANVKANTKNKHVQLAAGFAEQACLFAESFIGDGVVQQQAAVADLNKRLADNGIEKSFTQEQMLSYVNKAYAALKSSGQLATVKKVASDEDIAEAEKVVDNTSEKAAAPSETAE